MREMTNGFDWDAANVEKCRKHGVSIEEIESLFYGQVDVFPDVIHSRQKPDFWVLEKHLRGGMCLLPLRCEPSPVSI